ncbi:MAG TPA: SET domain-containing protein-lysine N-methyltransferase [Candidatus Doudnabacteria bacterium]|nr:SET domain-containing protein-lysine N-methyltransferase [Candidatus Doudnabacteria bacterium]
MNKLVIKNGAKGTGVFTIKSFSTGDKIFNFSGDLIPRSPITENLSSPADDRYLQVGVDLFIGPSGNIDDHVNHSCEPNTGVLLKNNRAQLIAIRNIIAGEEITYDYSIQMYNEPWTMECMCGSENCRGVIKEYRHLPQQIKDKYLKLGLVPHYNKDL